MSDCVRFVIGVEMFVQMRKPVTDVLACMVDAQSPLLGLVHPTTGPTRADSYDAA